MTLGEDLGFPEGDGTSMEQQTKGAAATWTELVAQWQASLEQLAVEFMRGVATVAPRPGACEYCDLASLCRINERQTRVDQSGLENGL